MTEIQLSLRLHVHSLLPGDEAAHDVMQQTNATLRFRNGTNKAKALAGKVAKDFKGDPN